MQHGLPIGVPREVLLITKVHSPGRGWKVWELCTQGIVPFAKARQGGVRTAATVTEACTAAEVARSTRPLTLAAVVGAPNHPTLGVRSPATPAPQHRQVLACPVQHIRGELRKDGIISCDEDEVLPGPLLSVGIHCDKVVRPLHDTVLKRYRVALQQGDQLQHVIDDFSL